MNGKKAKLIRKMTGYRPGGVDEYAQGVMINYYTWTDDLSVVAVAGSLGMRVLSREQALDAGVPDAGNGSEYCLAGSGPVRNKTRASYNSMRKKVASDKFWRNAGNAQ